MCSCTRNVYDRHYAQHIEKNKITCRSCAQIVRYGNQFMVSHLHDYKQKAKSRGIAWALVLADLEMLWKKQNGRCALSGEELYKNPKTWSIDRLDNSCGYFPDNIQLTSVPINMMRGSLPVEKFISYCQQVASYRSNNG